MKHLTEYISEAEVYKVPESFYNDAVDILKDICSKLQQSTKKSKLLAPQPVPRMGYNNKDQVKYTGVYGCEILYNFWNHGLKDFESFKRIWNIIFENQPISESLFDDDIVTKEMAGTDEYIFIKGIYDCLCDIFKVKDLSSLKKPWDRNVPFAKAITQLPTFKKDSIYTSLTNVYAHVKNDILYININFEQYMEKDPNIVASIKQANANIKPLDCVGRELMVGDTVAYVATRGSGGWRTNAASLDVGVVDAVNKSQVTVDGKRMNISRCCLISRKDGKMIE